MGAAESSPPSDAQESRVPSSQHHRQASKDQLDSEEGPARRQKRRPDGHAEKHSPEDIARIESEKAEKEQERRAEIEARYGRFRSLPLSELPRLLPRKQRRLEAKLEEEQEEKQLFCETVFQALDSDDVGPILVTRGPNILCSERVRGHYRAGAMAVV